MTKMSFNIKTFIRKNGEMAEFTREMYNDLKESGYINDESVIIQMSHEIGKELSDILSQKPEITELSHETLRKIILGEIDNSNNGEI